MLGTKSILAAVTLVGLGFAGAASADVVSYNIQRTGMDPGEIGGAQGTTHVGNWNNWTGSGGGTGSTRTWSSINSAGASTSISATITKLDNGAYSGGDLNDDSENINGDGDLTLYTSGFDMGDFGDAIEGQSAGPALSISASNIPYASYDVLVYTRFYEGGDAMVRMTAGTAAGMNRTLKSPDETYLIPDPETDKPYLLSTATTFANSTPGHYVQFTGLTSTSFTFDISTNGRTQPVGFQIVSAGAPVPEPASLGVLALAGLGLLARRRSDKL